MFDRKFKLLLVAMLGLLVLAACGGSAGDEMAEGDAMGDEMAEGDAMGDEMAEGDAMGDDMAEGDAMGDDMSDGEMMEHTQSHVNVEDQDASGGTVVVGDIYSFEGPAWIVIHADNGSGGPGAIIGFAAVAEGQNDPVTVEIDLEQATPVLYAMLHTDAGTVGEYEFPGPDGPVSDGDGNVITPPFNVTLP